MLAKKISYLIIVLFALSLAKPVFAYVMSSTNYQIERDSINFAGGLSSSSSYGIETTLGEIGSGYSSSTTYTTQAGYQQLDVSWVSLSVPTTGSLTPNINSITGGIASTSVNFIVSTNNSSGYTLQMKASTSPALKGSAFDFTNYTLAGAAPEYTWSVAGAVAEFGFTPEGNDIVDRYRDTGGVCDQVAGADTTDTCWDAPSTSYVDISQSVAPNYPTTATTTIKFRAEAGASSAIAIGSYVADMIITAYTN